MCRFVAYKGTKALMADLLIETENSLIVQSYAAKQRYKSLNGDGFGIAWYPLHDDPVPGVFTSILPAWADRNLTRLSDKIYSRCFFAHVRDATPGLPIAELNCHPFRYKNLIFMHNGRVAGFAKMRRQLRESLSDEMYNMIEGNTDSEHVFALILDYLENKTTPSKIDIMQAITKAFGKIEQWNKAHKETALSYLNIAITDGHQMVATRYVTEGKKAAASLYVSSGRYRVKKNQQIRVYETEKAEKETIIIASEPLTEWQEDWHKVSRNQIIAVNENNHLSIEPLIV